MNADRIGVGAGKI